MLSVTFQFPEFDSDALDEPLEYKPSQSLNMNNTMNVVATNP